LGSGFDTIAAKARCDGHATAENMGKTMDLSKIGTIPEIKSAVLGDLGGVLIESLNHPDGEAMAAVMGFTASQFGAAGEMLGLGALRRIALTGTSAACLIALQASSAIAVYFDPSKSMTVIEKKLEGLLNT
jgi:predicted regulator of Ras-like GTPase activity (Roadblock/LC7/MglB family)